MNEFIEPWKVKIAAVLSKLSGQEVSPSQVTAETPPRPDMGDLGFPMFHFAKLLSKAPAQIASLAAAELPGTSAQGPYLNVMLPRGEAAKSILGPLLDEKAPRGAPRGYEDFLKGQRIMVEYSSPNTNKPLHLGHLRNDVLGESVSRILGACGAQVRRVCIINDRGIHICKSMLAYADHGEGKTPQSEGIKSDHFVGHWYVRFNDELKTETEALEGLSTREAEAQAPLTQRAQELLRLWEAGDPATVDLWKRMNTWAFEGWQETYRRTGVSFDQFYYESQTYLLGKDEILRGLDEGIFYKEEDGSVQVDLEAEKLDKKVLLRKDGTSLYIVQDIGTAIYRHKDWPFDSLVYVVASEQNYHFKVLFTLMEKLGYPWAPNLRHLSYGMVNLPEGKMKSREGTVVDADDLLDSLRDMALEEIRSKEREELLGDPIETAEKVALGALHYFLTYVSPTKDMLFDPAESLSFNGNTGPYLQYMGARISSLLRKAAEEEAPSEPPNLEILHSDAEWELIKTLGAYSETLKRAALEMDPSLVAAYLYDLAKSFSRFYHDCPILSAEDGGLKRARLQLCRAVCTVLKAALDLVCIPFLEEM
ncbi:MAG: arginine--tRNA ligase [Treponema sp.]|nr:arginine--tRNA ligase [Treponema sp.]